MSQMTTPSDPDVPIPPADPDSPNPGPDDAPPLSGADAPIDQELAESRADETTGAPTEAPASAGESGEATEDTKSSAGEIIIGEIPDADDLSVMRWTARCTLDEHDLLGYFDSRSEAEAAGAEHVASAHSVS
jgi:hypothetical protein